MDINNDLASLGGALLKGEERIKAIMEEMSKIKQRQEAILGNLECKINLNDSIKTLSLEPETVISLHKLQIRRIADLLCSDLSKLYIFGGISEKCFLDIQESLLENGLMWGQTEKELQKKHGYVKQTLIDIPDFYDPVYLLAWIEYYTEVCHKDKKDLKDSEKLFHRRVDTLCKPFIMDHIDITLSFDDLSRQTKLGRFGIDMKTEAFLKTGDSEKGLKGIFDINHLLNISSEDLEKYPWMNEKGEKRVLRINMALYELYKEIVEAGEAGETFYL